MPISNFLRGLQNPVQAPAETIVKTSVSTIPNRLPGKVLAGDDKSNVLSSSTKNIFVGGGGDDVITGKGTGFQVAAYSKSIDKYKITTNPDGSFTITALEGNEGTDIVKNVSYLSFNGKIYKAQPTEQGSLPVLTLVAQLPNAHTTPSTPPVPADGTDTPVPPPTTEPPPVSSQPPAPTPTPSTPEPSQPPVSTTPDAPAPTQPPVSTAPEAPTSGTPPVSSQPPQPTPDAPAPVEPPSSNSPSPTTPPSQGAPTEPAPSPSAPPSSTAPATTDIVGFSLQNTSGAAEGTGYVTFGQVFTKGSVMPGDTLVAKINGQDVPVQMDVKTTNPDGSVSHAILTLKAPPLAVDGSVSGMLAKSSAPAVSAAPIQAQDMVSHINTQVQITLHNADGSTTVKTIDAASLLQQSINNGSVETWLQGPQASEYRVETNIAPNLDVKLDIRMDAAGKVHTDVIFARDDAYTTQVGTITYDVKITQDGATAYSHSNVQQYAYSTWHTDVSSAGTIAPQVIYDMQYLIATGTIPAYDLSTTISQSAIDQQMALLANANTGPMGNALLTQYMPMTGGRFDIGVETTWTAMYLTSQDPDAMAIMMANADAAGSVPWHLIDSNGDPVRIDLHPKLWVDSRGSSPSYGADGLPVPYNTTSSGWTVDGSHPPSLTFVPYMLTGEHYYLDEMQAAAAFQIANLGPGYRGYDEGLALDMVQTRQIAWVLRELSNAAFATPDADPMKAYFTTILEANMNALLDKYVYGPAGDAQGELEGWIDGGYASYGFIRPWMQDMVATELGVISARGVEQADTMLAWMDGFLSGRFLNEANGFDPLNGAAYSFNIINPATGTPYTTWEDLYQASFGASDPTAMNPDSYAAWAGGYAAYAKASLASVISVTHSADAIEAYGYLQSQTTAMVPSYANEPTWNIAPEIADGVYLNQNEVFVNTSTAGVTMTAGSTETMLIGGIGNDTVVGGSGIGMLFGMEGNDTIVAGSGNSYLYGDDGNDRLVDGAGSNYFKGGTGADVFAFTAGGSGIDTINDFTKGSDRIEIKANGAFTASDLVSRATADANGNAVLHIGTGGSTHDIVLQGVMLGNLTNDIFTIV